MVHSSRELPFQFGYARLQTGNFLGYIQTEADARRLKSLGRRHASSGVSLYCLQHEEPFFSQHCHFSRVTTHMRNLTWCTDVWVLRFFSVSPPDNYLFRIAETVGSRKRLGAGSHQAREFQGGQAPVQFAIVWQPREAAQRSSWIRMLRVRNHCAGSPAIQQRREHFWDATSQEVIHVRDIRAIVQSKLSLQEDWAAV